ncbi:sigma 54-interacting transcriptional regulator [Senegalia massiliensis]|uniref:CBS domain-containing protein n=1 Tax=Senegalia massiliensis TaxID=1720316 RepID=A0A845QZD8_9CLOT|nr:sigma 54-interacting transcriptional regulator [Senegalia massiliensis]NBI07314.1 CBS domain-containing protein [Senegalia massiliensis]
MRVNDVMTRNPITINQDKQIIYATKLMYDNKIDSLPVLDSKGELIGIFQKENLYYAISNNIDLNSEIKDIMNKDIKWIYPDQDTDKILDMNMGRNLVLDKENNLVGVLTNTDLLKAYYNTNNVINRKLDTEKNLTGTLKTILNNAYDGIVVIDKSRKITMINQSYAKFLNVDKDDVIGKDVTNVIENTRLHVILDTGESEIGEIQKIGSRNIVAMRIPIVEDGKVVGAIGKIMFRDIQQVNSLANKLNVIKNELKYYKKELIKERRAKYSFENIPSNSDIMNKVKLLAQKSSKSNSTILVVGESGTGKELFAHSIHNASPRKLKPFVKMNCAAIPEDLLESELFGYEEGAFTGSKKGGKIGKFKLADGGTIFLDEIGDMPLNMQAKILRVLQEKELEPIGSNKTHPIDVRVISATNKDLSSMIRKGEFREDLYYRLNVIKLNIPPLRERKEDLDILIDILLEKHKGDVGKYIKGISDGARNVLKTYHWPGNVRQLENVLERAINIVESGCEIDIPHLPEYIRGKNNNNEESSFSLKKAVEITERNTIINALELTSGNRVHAAKILNISRSSLYEKMDKYKIE